MSRFAPALLVEVDLDAELPRLELGAYTRAVCLVRIHDRPVGIFDVDRSVDGAELAAGIDAAFGNEIRRHLADDGIAAPDALSEAGLARSGTPPCARARADAIASGPDVTVVVPTCGRPSTLVRAVTSLLAQDYPRLKVVVVDNAPVRDGAAAAVAALDGTGRIRYVRESRRGHSWARNRGLAEAETELVAFVDDDTVADRRWLSALVAPFHADPTIGCVSGTVLPLELETQAQAWREEYDSVRTRFTARVHDLGARRPDDPLFPFTTGRLGFGACMAFRTDVLRSVGGFEPALGSGARACGGEELLAFVRVLRAGHAMMYEPAAVVRHEHYREYERLRRQMYGYGVGLGAYLLAAVADEPGLIVHFGRRIVPAIRHLTARRSSKNAARTTSFPRSLALAELRGLTGAPRAYLRGRAAARALAAASAEAT